MMMKLDIEKSVIDQFGKNNWTAIDSLEGIRCEGDTKTHCS
jgi:hypothetical protein